MQRLKRFFSAVFGWMWGARMRRAAAPVLILALIAAAAAGPLVYARRLADAKAFWDVVMGNLLAMTIALVAAVPIAYWLAGARRKPEEPPPVKAAENEQPQALHAPEKELFVLFKAELALNLKFVEERRAKPDHLHPLPFKPDFWDATLAAGDLRLVSSRKMLDHLAGAYYMVRLVRRTEELTYRALTSATVKFGNKTAVDLLIEDAQRLYDPLRDSLTDTLREIDKHVKSLAKPVSVE